MDKKLNFVLADDHPLFRKALRRIVEKHKRVKAVFEAANGDEVVAIFKNEKVDLLFLDYSMPGMNGYDTAAIILGEAPASKIIVLTQYDEIPVILNFFKIGVRGFLTKNADEKEILESISAVLDGNYYYHSRFDDTISRWLADGLVKTVPSIKFSQRDMQIVVAMSKGKTSEEIGQQLGLSVRSIEAYRSSLLRGVNVKNTGELLDYVYRNGIV